LPRLKLKLRPIKPIISWLRTSKESKIRKIANRLYLNRQTMQQSGDADRDWLKAEYIYKSSIRQFLFWTNQNLIQLEKRAIEPAAKWVDNADLFRLIERISPALEALGVLAIPLVLFFATQGYQENLRQQELERLQQQAVKDYLNQLSTILLDAKGNLRDPQNEQLRILTTATTLTLFREPNLDGDRKGQVVEFLAEMRLVNVNRIYGPQLLEDEIPTISLDNADLRYVNLLGADLALSDLSGANLRYANLINADLSDANLDDVNLNDADLALADLIGAALNDAELNDANLRYADLRGATLNDAELRDADLALADLIGANLIDAELNYADLRSADLRGATLNDADLSDADLALADLIGANLIGAELNYADLRSADLRGADLDDAKVVNTFFGTGIGFSEEQKQDLIKRGAIFDGGSRDRESSLVPTPNGR
jgi:uncharacterized protein YjbI with pentapeptide repeats